MYVRTYLPILCVQLLILLINHTYVVTSHLIEACALEYPSLSIIVVLTFNR